MRMLQVPAMTNSIVAAINRHEKKGEVVTRVFISPNVHTALIEEAWIFAQVVVDHVGSLMQIPVEIDTQLHNNDFSLDTEKGYYRNDA